MTPSTEEHARIHAEVLDLECRRRQALTSRDGITLGELIAKDCVYIHSRGRVESGESYLTAFGAGDFAYARILASESQVIAAGAAAIVAYLQTADMVIDGHEHRSTSRCSATWRWGDDGPRLVLFHATAVT